MTALACYLIELYVLCLFVLFLLKGYNMFLKTCCFASFLVVKCRFYTMSIYGLLCWCFMALRHILGHFGLGQLSYPYCSWASLLGSLPVLSAHSFASNWQLLYQREGENGRINYFMTNLHERMLPDARIERATVRIPGGRAIDRATRPASI